MAPWSLVKRNGIVIDLAALDISVRALPGAGMPPVRHIVIPSGSGVIYQGVALAPRKVVLRMQQRSRSARASDVRAALVSALSDFGGWLRYDDGIHQRQLPVVYADGLAHDASTPDGRLDSPLEVALMSYDPVWSATTTTHTTLGVRTTLDDADRIFLRHAGEWQALGALPGVEALFLARDGTLYAGGSFSGGAARWDGTTWVILGDDEPLSDGSVTAFTEGADGTIYLGGMFSGHVLAYDSVADTWAGVGNCPSFSTIRALLIANDGTLVVTGAVDGVPVVRRWNGSNWETLGSFAGGTVATSLALLDSTIVVGGDFSGGVAAWNGMAWELLGGGVTLSTGSGCVVHALATGIDGTLIVGGNFDRAGGLSVSYGALWDGIAWRGLNGGPADAIHMVMPMGGGFLVGGAFAIVNGRLFPGGLAHWNGYAWFALDITSSAQVDICALAVRDETIAVAYDGAAGSTSVGSITTVENHGSAPTYPVLSVHGPGRLCQVSNLTTGAELHFDLMLLTGEIVDIDLRAGNLSITSRFRGNMLESLIPGSSLAAWTLAPGANRIKIYLEHPYATATMAWAARYWSIDDDTL